jgi:hypothetical protein
VPFFFANKALYILDVFVRLFIFLLFAFFFNLNMLLEFASFCLFSGLAAAPPEVASPFTSMRTTRPIEILGFRVVSVTILAHFLVEVEVTSLFKFNNT